MQRGREIQKNVTRRVKRVNRKETKRRQIMTEKVCLNCGTLNIIDREYCRNCESGEFERLDIKEVYGIFDELTNTLTESEINLLINLLKEAIE